jgi:hypothetical protein
LGWGGIVFGVAENNTPPPQNNLARTCMQQVNIVRWGMVWQQVCQTIP